MLTVGATTIITITDSIPVAVTVITNDNISNIIPLATSMGIFVVHYLVFTTAIICAILLILILLFRSLRINRKLSSNFASFILFLTSYSYSNCPNSKNNELRASLPGVL